MTEIEIAAAGLYCQTLALAGIACGSQAAVLVQFEKLLNANKVISEEFREQAKRFARAARRI